MNKKTLHDLSNLEGKFVLKRVDFNVPVKEGLFTYTNRITAAMPKIKNLLDNNAKVVLFTHLGRVASEILFVSVTTPSLTGTLKSTLVNTTFPSRFDKS